MKETANELFQKVLKTEVRVEKVEIIGKSRNGENIVQAKLFSLKDKLEIMRSKYRLSNHTRRIFIDDDLLPNDRRIQREIYAKVQQLRRDGVYCKAGFKKIYVNGLDSRSDSGLDSSSDSTKIFAFECLNVYLQLGSFTLSRP